ncbi:MAG: hypothetical protein EBR82_82725 [Caulobacteraceae bacterium]|nr:hypothetical protein [Caulobacteraceae bacterium]
MRFFCTADASLYEQVRLTLDAAWGHVAPTTCIEPAPTAPRDAQGRIVLAVNDEFCEYSVAVELLPQLLASGAVEEIDEAAYVSAVNRPA